MFTGRTAEVRPPSSSKMVVVTRVEATAEIGPPGRLFEDGLLASSSVASLATTSQIRDAKDMKAVAVRTSPSMDRTHGRWSSLSVPRHLR